MRKRVPFIAILMGPVRSISSTFIRRFKHDWATAFLSPRTGGPVAGEPERWCLRRSGISARSGDGSRRTRCRLSSWRPGAEVRWQIDRHAYLQADYGIFHAGEFLKQASPGRNISYMEFWAGYKF